jgi:hypothetical protein
VGNLGHQKGRPSRIGPELHANGGGGGPICALATTASVVVPVEAVLQLEPEQAA